MSSKGCTQLQLKQFVGCQSSFPLTCQTSDTFIVERALYLTPTLFALLLEGTPWQAAKEKNKRELGHVVMTPCCGDNRDSFSFVCWTLLACFFLGYLRVVYVGYASLDGHLDWVFSLFIHFNVFMLARLVVLFLFVVFVVLFGRSNCV
jgi:hypothetical protein